jgi:Mg/Co/Ni transporter MgtE
MLGHLLYLAAVVITVLVIAAKYFGVVIPNVTEYVMRDPAQSLLAALAMSLVARWI